MRSVRDQVAASTSGVPLAVMNYYNHRSAAWAQERSLRRCR